MCAHTGGVLAGRVGGARGRRGDRSRPRRHLGGSGGVVVLIAFGKNYTIELASSGVAVEPTRALARALSPADEAAWKAAGGQVIDCPPGGDACPN